MISLKTKELDPSIANKIRHMPAAVCIDGSMIYNFLERIKRNKLKVKSLYNLLSKM